MNTDQAITLTVSEANLSPSLTGVPGSATFAELTAYTFDADATDADIPTQTLTFSLVNGPHRSDDQQHQRRVQLDADRGPGAEHVRIQRACERTA